MRNNQDKKISSITILEVVAYATIVIGIYGTYYLWENHHLLLPDTVKEKNIGTHELKGTFGDFIGGIGGVFISFSSVLLFVSSLNLQRKELRESRENFQEEMRQTRGVHLEQLKEIQIKSEVEDFYRKLDVFERLEDRGTKALRDNIIILASQPNESLKKRIRAREKEMRKLYSSLERMVGDIHKSEYFRSRDQGLWEHHLETEEKRDYYLVDAFKVYFPCSLLKEIYDSHNIICEHTIINNFEYPSLVSFLEKLKQGNWEYPENDEILILIKASMSKQAK